MTIVEGTRLITGGVDTHLDVHVAAALDDIGGLLGVESFETSTAGNDKLLGWPRSFGEVDTHPLDEPDPPPRLHRTR